MTDEDPQPTRGNRPRSGPIAERLVARMESELTERDRSALAHGLVEAAMMGARVDRATLIANAAEAGMDVSRFSTDGLASTDLWPAED